MKTLLVILMLLQSLSGSAQDSTNHKKLIENWQQFEKENYDKNGFINWPKECLFNTSNNDFMVAWCDEYFIYYYDRKNKLRHIINYDTIPCFVGDFFTVAGEFRK